MISHADNVVSLMIMDRNYLVKCPPEEAAQLRESAQYLDAQMRKLGQPVAAGNTERLAIIAALNITHELMMYKNQRNSHIDGMQEQIKSLQQRIQQFLGQRDEATV